MPENHTSYKQIVKATSIFGGVQIFNICIAIAKSKIIALVLGPTGFGISGLLNTTSDFISSILNGGLNSSAVRRIVISDSENNKNHLNVIIAIIRNILFIVGLIGALLVLLFSDELSKRIFHSLEFSVAFRWIAVAIFFQQLTAGELIVLQGLRKLRNLALANVIGSSLSLIFTIPLYYYWGIEAIAPSIFISAILTFFAAKIYTSKHSKKQVKVENGLLIKEGKNLYKLGFALSLSGIITIGTSYFLRLHIGSNSSFEELGLFTAGFAILNTYVGIVFKAMSTDYFPRLSSIVENLEKRNEFVNQQSEVTLLLLTPIMLVFAIFVRYIIKFFYTDEFTGVETMLQYSVIGIYLKAAAWAVAFIILSKGDSRLFLINEVIANVYMLFFNILGYQILGLDGLGISFTMGYLVYFFQIYLIVKHKYYFQFEKEFIQIFVICFTSALLLFLLIKNFNHIISFVLQIILFIIVFLYCLRELDSRIKFLHKIKLLRK